MTKDLSEVLEIGGGSNSQRPPTNGNNKDMNRNATSYAKKASLYSFIVFLSISAVLAIICVLSGKFGEFEIKVLITTSAIAVASICALCCSAYFAQTGNAIPGLGGMTIACASAAMIIYGAWTEMNSEGYWKATAILCIFAIAAAHSLALLAVRLRPWHRWFQVATAINILILAATISAMILNEAANESVLKPIAVLAILAALETLVIPILGRLVKVEGNKERETLQLTKRADGKYEDPQGRLYAVTSLSNKRLHPTSH